MANAAKLMKEKKARILEARRKKAEADEKSDILAAQVEGINEELVENAGVVTGVEVVDDENLTASQLQTKTKTELVEIAVDLGIEDVSGTKKDIIERILNS